MTSYLCERAGMCVGTALSLMPSKLAGKGIKTTENIVTKELSNAASKAIATKMEQKASSFAINATKKTSSQTSQNTLQVAKQRFVVEGGKIVKQRASQNYP